MTPIENEPEKEPEQEPGGGSVQRPVTERKTSIEPSELSHRDWAEFAQLAGLMDTNDPSDGRLTSERRRFKYASKWIFLALSVLLLLLWLGLTNRISGRGPQSDNNANSVNSQPTPTEQASGKIVVDIHGDVPRPGVYELPANARVQDAIKAAGGFVHVEDAQFINAAMALDDGQEVFVPGPSASNSANASVPPSTTNPSQTTLEAAAANRVVSGAGGNTIVARLDINTADEASFETLPGIGPTRAAAIVEYRNQHGGFGSVTELKNVPGIGPKTWEKIQPYLAAAPNK